MTLEEVRSEIQKATGIPEGLLTGETIEENIAQAKALLAYRREATTTAANGTREQFADWLGGRLEERGRQTAAALGLSYEKDPAGAALASIEAAAGVNYPKVNDGGEVDGSKLPDQRPAREQFADWFKGAMVSDFNAW